VPLVDRGQWSRFLAAAALAKSVRGRRLAIPSNLLHGSRFHPPPAFQFSKQIVQTRVQQGAERRADRGFCFGSVCGEWAKYRIFLSQSK
jgi:hypothetical protein